MSDKPDYVKIMEMERKLYGHVLTVEPGAFWNCCPSCRSKNHANCHCPPHDAHVLKGIEHQTGCEYTGYTTRDGKTWEVEGGR